jgi:hypothetical protein
MAQRRCPRSSWSPVASAAGAGSPAVARVCQSDHARERAGLPGAITGAGRAARKGLQKVDERVIRAGRAAPPLAAVDSAPGVVGELFVFEALPRVPSDCSSSSPALTPPVAGDAGIQILQAYVVKEELRNVLALAGTNPERHLIRTRLDNFYQHAAAADAPEAHRLAATIEAWWPAIEAGILTGYSNARSEGYNRLAKHQGRNAFGFRNPINQRRRIRYACTRQHRRASAVSSTLPGQV